MPAAIARFAPRDALHARLVNTHNVKRPQRQAPAVDVIQHLIEPIDQERFAIGSGSWNRDRLHGSNTRGVENDRKQRMGTVGEQLLQRRSARAESDVSRVFQKIEAQSSPNVSMTSRGP